MDTSLWPAFSNLFSIFQVPSLYESSGIRLFIIILMSVSLNLLRTPPPLPTGHQYTEGSPQDLQNLASFFREAAQRCAGIVVVEKKPISSLQRSASIRALTEWMDGGDFFDQRAQGIESGWQRVYFFFLSFFFRVY